MSNVEPVQTREEILKSSLDARIQEVMHYQINIDNYRIALEEISKMSDDDRAMLSGFADQLRTLMSSEKLEQKKAQIMLTVLQKQVG
jgi:undecaprenyl pyrophosphate synthase